MNERQQRGPRDLSRKGWNRKHGPSAQATPGILTGRSSQRAQAGCTFMNQLRCGGMTSRPAAAAASTLFASCRYPSSTAQPSGPRMSTSDMSRCACDSCRIRSASSCPHLRRASPADSALLGRRAHVHGGRCGGLGPWPCAGPYWRIVFPNTNSTLAPSCTASLPQVARITWRIVRSCASSGGGRGGRRGWGKGGGDGGGGGL